MLPTPAPPRATLRTLGCRLNQAESDEIRAALAARGIEPSSDVPDVVVVNTCTVTADASKASRKLIRRSVVDHPDAQIVVTGCYAVAEPETVAAIPGVDLVVSNQDKGRLVDQIVGTGKSAAPVAAALRSPRANLKIQTGCDEKCTFCIVPQTRGGLASRPPGEVLAAARAMAKAGVREVVLTGVHLGKYGWDLGTEPRLPDILRQLGAIPGLERIRLSSIEASQIDDGLIGTLATQPKACRHLHIPLQTGDTRLWSEMRRPGTLDHFNDITRRAKGIIEDLTLTTDVMVGFPGEDEPAFANTIAAIEAIGFRKLHVFRFSPREGTPAAADPRRVDPGTLRDRSRRLRLLGDRMRAFWLQEQPGRVVRVLVEQAQNSGAHRRPRLSGLSDNYLRVHTAGPAGLVGRTVDVLVTSIGRDAVEGDIVGGLPVLQDR